MILAAAHQISDRASFTKVDHPAIICRPNNEGGPHAYILRWILLLAAGPALAADKYVGSNVDVRTILAFKVADAPVQKFLPEGWELDVATAGTAKDVNPASRSLIGSPRRTPTARRCLRFAP